MWFTVPNTASVLPEFTTLKTKLQAVIAHHADAAAVKTAQVANHTAEVSAASKALKAVEQFI